MQGTTRDANALRKHRNALAQHRIARTKLLEVSASRFKEMPVPQPLLSLPYNAHRSGVEFRRIIAKIENGTSRTLSRKFWQQKYFRENLLFARSMLATANFFGNFRKPIRKSIPVRKTFSEPREEISQSSSRRKMESELT